MPKMSMTIGHKLTQQEAVEHIKKGLEDIKKEFAEEIQKLDVIWNENICEFALSVSGYSSKGTAEVRESEIEIKGEVPFTLYLFKEMLETQIRKRMEKILG